jgi:hypothetical protein
MCVARSTPKKENKERERGKEENTNFFVVVVDLKKKNSITICV